MHQESTAQGLQCSVQHSLQVQVLLLAVQLEEMHPHICSVPLSSAAYLWVLKKCCLSFIRLPGFFLPVPLYTAQAGIVPRGTQH